MLIEAISSKTRLDFGCRNWINPREDGVQTCKRDDPELATLMVAIRAGLAREIGPKMAATIAYAKCDLWRVRLVRQAVLADLWDCPIVDVVRRLGGLERYERRALAAQKRALRSL